MGDAASEDATRKHAVTALDAPRGALTLRAMPEEKIALAAMNVHRRYTLSGHELHVLRGVSLEVHEGERVFLCGASGSGKTTLLYTLGGLEKPNAGEVFVAGEAMYSARSRERARLRNTALGFVFQNYHLLPELTALENVALPSLIGSRPARDRAKELLGRVGLGERLQHLPTELSGGEQQRVALARSLINDPKLILADEPTGNLDAATGRHIMDLLFQIVAESKKTLVVVTHDANLAARGDRTLMLRQGLLEAA
jgi:putative ABC transport system ATP-binding protein/lipoprotein-releasing system ATP-binding protein